MSKALSLFCKAILCAIAVCWCLFPLVYLIIISFAGTGPLPTKVAIPENFTLNNWAAILIGERMIWRYIFNSLAVATLSTFFGLLISLPSAYAISRRRDGLTRFAFSFLLVFRMVPYIALLIPVFLLMKNLNLLDSLAGLSLAHLIYTVPISVWLMKGFFDVVPVSVEEAAVMEGAGRFRIFATIALPLSAPGIATTATISFLLSYIEFLFTSILSRRDTFTLAMYFSTFLSDHDTRWRFLSASAVFSIIPIILLFVFAQKYLIKGLTIGSYR